MKSIALLISLFSISSLFSQENTDTIKVHSVRKAMILSAVAPGAGQVYNHIAMPKGKKRAHIKVPLIYAGLGATGYFLVTNLQTQKALKAEYQNRQDGNPTDPNWQAYDDDGILTLYNQFLDRRDLSILALSAVYLFQIADAGVEAHFVRFDISTDLSASIKPVFFTGYHTGLMLTFNFR